MFLFLLPATPLTGARHNMAHKRFWRLPCITGKAQSLRWPELIMTGALTGERSIRHADPAEAEGKAHRMLPQESSPTTK